MNVYDRSEVKTYFYPLTLFLDSEGPLSILAPLSACILSVPHIYGVLQWPVLISLKPALVFWIVPNIYGILTAMLPAAAS